MLELDKLKKKIETIKSKMDINRGKRESIVEENEALLQRLRSVLDCEEGEEKKTFIELEESVERECRRLAELIHKAEKLSSEL
jgi:hypothetical protein